MIKWKGVTFRLHPLFVLIMLASIATGRLMDILTLFVIVLWHELGHLAAAIHYGWTVKEVKLLPFGGVLEVEEAGTLPVKEEVGVAIAGPIQNVILAGISLILAKLGWIDTEWSTHFIHANLVIALFNLMPILPLDGGRMLQAWMSKQIPFHRTLLLTCQISLILSGLTVLASFYPLLNGGLLHLNLLVIGLFLCASNWAYYRNIPYLFLRFLVHRSEGSEKRMNTGVLSRPIVITDNGALSTIIRLFMKEQYHLIYIMKSGKINNVVPEKMIIDGFLGRITTKNADLRFFM